MKTKNTRHFLYLALSFLIIFFLLGTDIADARGGFGGSRGGSRSFGGSRSSGRGLFSSPGNRGGASSAPRSSFGGSRSSLSSPAQQKVSSFGGSRMNSASDYTAKYGVPRKSISSSQMSGVPSNMVVHDYGGYGSGLMMGYMMGHTSWMWFTPFHPAFYYSRPYYVENPDGTTSVYPPTFSWGKIFFMLIILMAVVYIIYVYFRNKKRRSYGYSKSSFD